jgi:hypothetical protein
MPPQFGPTLEDGDSKANQDRFVGLIRESYLQSLPSQRAVDHSVQHDESRWNITEV